MEVQLQPQIDEQNSLIELPDSQNKLEEGFGELEQLLEIARINVDQVLIPILKLCKTPELDAGDHLLLEVPHKLAESVNDGQTLQIKGNLDSGDCVLCTKDTTHEILGAEVSNALLLTPGFFSEKEGKIFPQEVTNIIHDYYELKPITPCIDAGVLLQPSAYSGSENEASIPKAELYSKPRLYYELMASDTEIDAELASMKALELNGFVRMLEDNYLCSLVSELTELLEDRSVLPVGDICSSLEIDHAPEIVEHVMNAYGSIEDGSWTPHEDQMCQFYAELLLRSTNKFNLSDFIEAWKQSVPRGMNPTLEHVKGMAYVQDGQPAVICYLSEKKLPANVKDRLQVLFNAKSTWDINEITPYLEALACGKLTVGVILTKYSRSYNKDGKKVYTSRYKQ